jgi:pantoate--beta-alanine ligase
MRIIEKISEMQNISNEMRKSYKTIAVVPTMGYLHEGHCSLIRLAKETADFCITTLFVNPTQFAPNEDFEKYPRDFERDFNLAKTNGSDFLFNPSVEEMYPSGFSSEIKIKEITEKFEGKFRPLHFNGVATVVAKLFNATLPDFAIFGQKDYQQTLVIKQLVKDFNFPVSIVVAPTIREHDGLAMSSRNVYLSTTDRNKATILYKALNNVKEAIKKGTRKKEEIDDILKDTLLSLPEIQIDYASSALADSLNEPDYFESGQKIVLLLACKLGKTRLIDNMVITID